MNTARLIARFLQSKARSLRARCCFEAVLALGICFAILLFQYVYYFLAIWFCVCFQGGEVVEIVLVAALLPVALQFVGYSLAGDYYRDPTSAIVVSPTRRLLYGGFFLVGPQTFADALRSLRKAWRINSTDFDNCANVLYVMMREHDAITFEQAWDAISVRQNVNTTIDQLRMFPGVIVLQSGLNLTAALRVEIAEFCRSEKERIRESVAVDGMDQW
jgi:hypothetical protein